MRFQDTTRRRPSVNMTSLIDVLFLLLTFFLITTQFIDQSALKVELPEMAHADRVQQVRQFVLSVGADGTMTLDGEPIGADALKERLSNSLSEIDAAGGLVMRADRTLAYGEVMRILDLVRGAGVRRISNAAADVSP